ncbi:unnamed protein product [Schistocephalus solidus]|uniref:Endo/exonuclease/phosphatase domain-containing protein n=1 Tax=Schistocephalus solidus TaxID=70667 RepID=A0A183SLY8_SCHSO|nr:unnamed protein product [Schistocephalus solidus]
MSLFEVGFFPAATPRATVTTGGLNLVRVSGFVCASTPAVSAGGGGCRLHILLERTKAERRDAGVTFAIRNDIVGRLPCLPQGIKDRLMSPHLPFRGDQFSTILNAYAPPMTSSDAANDKFYENLLALRVTVSKVDKLIFLGDFNAHVGMDHAALHGVLGPHGIGSCNDYGVLLL